MRSLQTRDIFSLARVLKEAKIQETLKGIYEKTDIKNSTERQIGMTVIFEVIEKLVEENCEEKIYKFLAGPLEKSIDEIASMDPVELIENIFEIASLEKWKDFLAKASQLIK